MGVETGGCYASKADVCANHGHRIFFNMQGLAFFRNTRLKPTPPDKGGIALECRTCRSESVWWDLFAALGDAVFMNILGLATGSMALHAEGLHSLGDFLTKGVTLVSVKTARKAPTKKFPYGFGKLLFLSSALVGISLMAGALFFIYENFRHINEGLMEAPKVAAILGPIISMLASWVMYRYLVCVGYQNNNLAIVAAAQDNRMDLLSSMTILVGLFFAVGGWPMADHITAILASLFAVHIGGFILAQSVNGLLDRAIPDQVLENIRQVARETPGVLAVRKLRGRILGETWDVDLHLEVDGQQTVLDTYQISRLVRERIQTNVKHTGQVHITPVPSQPGAVPFGGGDAPYASS